MTMKNIFVQLIWTLILKIGSSQTESLSFIDLVPSDTFVVNTVRGKGAKFTWLQEVRENHNTSNSKKAFIRSIYKNFSSSVPTQDKLYDIKNQLVMQAYEQVEISCAVFYNKTQNKYFIYKFKQQQGQQYPYLYFEQEMLKPQAEQNQFKMGLSCYDFLVNGEVLGYRNNRLKQPWGKGQYYWVSFQLNSYRVVAIESNFDCIVLENYLLLHFIQEIFVDQENNSQFSQYYYQSVSIDLVQYSNAEVRYYQAPQSPVQAYYKGVIIFAFKQVENKFIYKIYVIYEDVDWQTKIIDQIIGQSQEQPYFQCSQKLTKFIVYGSTKKGEPFYEGYYVNFFQAQTTQIYFPVSISKFYNFLSLNQHFLYARNKKPTANNKSDQSAYTFVRQSLFSYYQQKVIQQPQFNSNWVTSFIQAQGESVSAQSFLSFKMVILHLHQFYNRYYFKREVVSSFEQLQASQYNKLVLIKLTVNKAQSQLLSAENNLNYLQKAEQDQAIKIRITSYDPSVKTAKMIELGLVVTGNMDAYSASNNLDCFVSVDQENKVVTVYKAYLKEGGNITAIKNVTYEGQFQSVSIADQCLAVKINSHVYLMSQINGELNFALDQQTSNWTKPTFDSTFKFVIVGSAIYKNNGKIYQKIITSTFLQLNQIHVNEEGTKIVLFSQHSNRTRVQTKSFYLFNDVWKQIESQKNQLQGKQISLVGKAKVSKDLSKVGFCYNITIFEENPNRIDRVQLLCLFKSIDYSAGKSYQVTYPYGSLFQPLILNVQNSLIHMIFRTSLKYYQSQCRETTFQLTQKELIMIVSYKVDCMFYASQNSVRRIVTEYSNGSFTYLTEFSNSSLLTVYRSPLKSVQIINQQFSILGLNRGFFSLNQSLYECSPGCISCYSSYYCRKCANGYALDLDVFKCIKCIGPCGNCKRNKLTACLSCPDGFYFDYNKETCKKCHVNCVTCSDKGDTKCLTCRIGHFLNNNSLDIRKRKTCLVCPQNCDICLKSASCTTCKFGYSVASNRTCTRCPLDCIQCKADQVITCLSCMTGFQMVTINEKKQCQKCPSYCQTCSSGKCSVCRIGYKLDKQKNICYQACVSPCLKCSQTNHQSCTACIQGYILNGTVCSNDLSCNLKASCISCPSKFVLIAKKCYECPDIKNCKQCSTQDPTKCLSCVRGYYLIDQKCNACSIDCQNCYALSICVTCKDGFMLTTKGDASQCVVCAQNCKTCIQSTTNCQSCINGYRLEGSFCNSQKTIAFAFKLNLDFTTFTNAIYLQILSQLAALTNKSITLIRINTFSKGSLVVGGSIDVSNLNDQSQTLSALSSSLSQGSKIGGQPIISAKFTGFSPLPEQTTVGQQKSNMALILGIVIPASISNSLLIFQVLIGLTILIIYKKFFSVKEVKPVQQQSDRSNSQTQLQSNDQKKQAINASPTRKNGFMPKAKRRAMIKQ